MLDCSKHDVELAPYPFSDHSGAKVRPAVIVNAPHPSHDFLIAPLTSRLADLLPGEFALAEWAAAGLLEKKGKTADAKRLRDLYARQKDLK